METCGSAHCQLSHDPLIVLPDPLPICLQQVGQCHFLKIYYFFIFTKQV